jgi:hypothetical protein
MGGAARHSCPIECYEFQPWPEKHPFQTGFSGGVRGGFEIESARSPPQFDQVAAARFTTRYHIAGAEQDGRDNSSSVKVHAATEFESESEMSPGGPTCRSSNSEPIQLKVLNRIPRVYPDSRKFIASKAEVVPPKQVQRHDSAAIAKIHLNERRRIVLCDQSSNPSLYPIPQPLLRSWHPLPPPARSTRGRASWLRHCAIPASGSGVAYGRKGLPPDRRYRSDGSFTERRAVLSRS